MKALHALKFGFFVVGTLALTSTLTQAQTVAPGPYYATPAWDQKLPASTRFIVLSNWASEAVLDRETGLVWERSPSNLFRTWANHQASSHCNNLNVGHRKGWKLPTIQELASLVDGDPTSSSSPTLPPGHPFQNVGHTTYWSATTFSTSSSAAWVVNFYDGRVLPLGKIIENPVWCVRGGSGVDPQ